MKLILLDRDGVLNRDLPDGVKSPEELEMLPGAAKAVARLNKAGYHTAVVTNQSVIGKGIITEHILKEIHRKLAAELVKEQGWIDGFFFCPDHPDKPTIRRKPRPGMLIEAMNHYHSLPENTIMIGDNITDLVAAKSAQCDAILVKTGKGAEIFAAGLPEEVQPVLVCDDLPAAVEKILNPI